MIDRFIRSRLFKILIFAFSAFVAMIIIARAAVFMFGSRSEVHTKEELYDIVRQNNTRLSLYSVMLEQDESIEVIIPKSVRYNLDNYTKISENIYGKFSDEADISREDYFRVANINWSYLFDELEFERVVIEGDCVFFVDNTLKNETTAVVCASSDREIPDNIVPLEISKIERDWYYIVYKKI